MPTNPISTYAYGYGDEDWGDLLTSYCGQTITYDAIGNPLSYYNGQQYTFTWENGRRLAAATVGGTNLTFTYNDEGIRTSKTVGNAEHIYHLNGAQIVFEECGETVIAYLYDAEGSPIGMQYRMGNENAGVFEEYWFEKNLQGDIVAVYDGEGTKLISYTYDAWGNFITTYDNGCTSSHHANLNPFRYRGYYYDTELGMYYLQSRYYDPEIGRWINADSQLNTSLGILGFNQYSYCLNNPVNMVDYGGNKPGDLFDSMDDAAIDFAEYINEESINLDREFGSFIYKITVWETKTVVYYNPNIFGNNLFSRLWNYIFCGGLTKTVEVRVKVTKYSYVVPKKGTSDSVSIPFNWLISRKKVAEIHTHAAYKPGYENDSFSAVDLNNWINYLVTPLGTVRKYDPADGSDIVIYTNAPYDPNHPRRK